jgi:hypothetical protein
MVALFCGITRAKSIKKSPPQGYYRSAKNNQGTPMVATHPTLFSWNDFEQTTPELQRFELAKEYLPDAG